MGYSISTCRDDFSDGGILYIRFRNTYSEAPFPETLKEGVLGPDFKTAVLWTETLTVNGVETFWSKYGSYNDPEESSNWADGDPNGDWLGSDYYMTTVDAVYTKQPDAYLEWFEDGRQFDWWETQSTIHWGSLYVDAEEFKKIKAGAEIIGFCTPLNDDGDPIDIGTATKEELDLVTDAEVVADYIDTIVIDEPSLLERGWDFIEDAVDKIKTRFSSPEYEWEDVPGHDDLYGDGYWLNTDAEATEHTGGTGLADFYEKASDTGASGLMQLLKDKVRDAGLGNLVDLFDDAGEAKELHDFNRDLIDQTMPMLDGFVIEDGEMRDIATLEEMEQSHETLRDRIAAYLDDNFPTLGTYFKQLTVHARHSDVSYQISLDPAEISPGDSHSNRVMFGDGNDRYNGRGDDDILLGGDGRDILRGGANHDWLSGGGLRDKLFGNAGRDDLSGGNGNDRLFGGVGNDRIDGGRGRDIIDGGRHKDILTGGGGKDVFVFTSNSGKDRITDFAANVRREDIDLSGVKGIKGYRDLANNHMEQIGDDVVISAGRFELTLENVDIRDLDRSDFLF